MYEMYPHGWLTTADQRPTSSDGDRPRRRVRKEHSVLPAVLAQSAKSVRDRGQDD